MADLNSEINNLIVGDDLDIVRTISGIPSGDALAKAWFTVKRQEDDLDARAIFQKIITATVGFPGQITDTGSGSGNGAVIFHLFAADTVLLTGGRSYFFDLQLRTSLGKIYTPEKGKLNAVKQITLATS